MIEIELILTELNRLMEKEKSLRRRIHLEQAMTELNKYKSLQPGMK